MAGKEWGGDVKITPSLGLTGVTMNAMALIAPGAFLWITYQMQAAATAPNGTSVASDIWAGIGLALVVAFLTAVSYAQLARLYPEAGFGSCYYFAEKAFLDRENREHHRWARLAKVVTGWAAHLFYWVYPGVMVAMMATLIGYIYTQFSGKGISTVGLDGIAVLFAFLTGYIAYRGVTGSTVTAIVINIVQLTTLVVFSVLAIYYRLSMPAGGAKWAFSGSADVMMPHTFVGVMIQSTIAILILVGFESCTAFAAETKNPRRNIPRAVVLSLIVQGLLAYMFEYFAAGYMVSDKLVGRNAAGGAVGGMEAAAGSSAPIGDMALLVGNRLLHGIGFGLMVTIAVTVAIAILGTTLSCLNTAVRISYAMAKDEEMPELLGAMHGKYVTPHRAIGVLVLVSAGIGIIGVQSVVGLTGITLASNLGTFVLYALTCLWTIVALHGRKGRSAVKGLIIPGLGILANVVMLISILYLYIIGNADSKHEALICFGLAGAWGLVSLIYVLVTNARKQRTIFGALPRPTVWKP